MPWFAPYMIVEHDNIICGTTRDTLDAFVRVLRFPDRRVIAIAEGHTCGWDAGAKELSGPVLDAVERALSANPAASIELLLEAARAAFLLAAEPYPEDELVGGPSAQLTVVALSPGRLRAGRLGRFEPLVVRAGAVHCDADGPEFNFIDRTPRTASMMEHSLRDGDIVVVSPQGFSDLTFQELPSILEELARDHRDPRSLVEAALSRWRNDVRQAQERGTLIGEPQLAFVAARV